MFTDTRQALLDAIRDHPEDDAPRLIYADWIEENGDPDRARFIRLQCEHSRLPRWAPQAEKIYKEYTRLGRKNRRRWLSPLPTWLQESIFHRGFVYLIRVTGTQFRESIRDIWRYEPMANISLCGEVPEFIAAIQDPLMAPVRELELSGLMGNEAEAIQAMIDSPHFASLQSFHFALPYVGTAFPPATLRALRDWQLPKLRVFTSALASGSPRETTEPIQSALAGSKLLATVEDVRICYDRGPQIAAAFQTAPTNNLRQLALADSPDDTPWLRVIAASKKLPRLHSLYISPSRASAKIWSDFIPTSVFRGLTKLTLLGNQWLNQTVKTLAQSPTAQNLEELILIGNTNLTDTAAKAIAASPYLKNLRYVNLIGTKISRTGVRTIRIAIPNCEVPNP